MTSSFAMLSTTGVGVTTLAQDSTSLYWLVKGTGEVRKTGKGDVGGKPIVLASDQNSPGSVAIVQ